MRYLAQNDIPDASKTKTIHDLGQQIGAKPEISKKLVTLYPALSLQKLTELLGAVYHKKDTTNLNEIESFEFIWGIKTNQIPRIRIAEDCNEDGLGGAIFGLVLERKFYDPRESFELDNEQQLRVHRYDRLPGGRCRVWVSLIGTNPDRRVNTTYLRKGRETKYVSNYQPELSERGYVKQMFNVEKHKNYISRHRVSDSYSGDFAKLNKRYLEDAGEYYQMTEMQKNMLDQMMLSFENSMLLSHGNIDTNGKCLDHEEDGREIYIGEGIIPQFKRFCGQQRYNTLSLTVLREAINDVVAKRDEKTNNTIVCVCNWRMYQQAQEVLDAALKERAKDAYFYDVNNDKIKVGAEYNAYEFAGNTIVFMENKALTDRYPEKGFGMIIDPRTPDGQMNIQLMTIKGMSLFWGHLKGMGGASGGASGDIATAVHGGEWHLMGYRGAKVANPYGGHFLEENILF